MVNAAAVVGRRLSPLRPMVVRLQQRRQRRAFIRKATFAAAYAGATLELQVDHGVSISPRVNLTFRPGSTNVLHIGEGTTLADDVQILFKGGALLLGKRCDVRHNVVFNMAGRLEVGGDAILSWGTVFHCSNTITIGRMVGIAERVTVVDSSHYFTEKEAFFYHNNRPGEISVGDNTWLCPNSVLTRTAHVGDHCIVGSNSVVVGVVPSGHLASGVPAVLSPLSLPWEQPDGAPKAGRKQPGARRTGQRATT